MEGMREIEWTAQWNGDMYDANQMGERGDDVTGEDATEVEKGWTPGGKSSSVQQREHRENIKRVDGSMAMGETMWYD